MRLLGGREVGGWVLEVGWSLAWVWDPYWRCPHCGGYWLNLGWLDVWYGPQERGDDDDDDDRSREGEWSRA